MRLVAYSRVELDRGWIVVIRVARFSYLEVVERTNMRIDKFFCVAAVGGILAMVGAVFALFWGDILDAIIVKVCECLKWVWWLSKNFTRR